MFLGIEIGGTKLQLGIGAGDGSPLVAVERAHVDPARGAAGILEHIERLGAALLQKHSVQRVGVGFGGPVDAAAGRTRKSHQIAGWDDFPLADWCSRTFSTPTVIGNDCDAAALAEARFGAGRGSAIVFYVTVGTGVGGGLVIDGRLHGTSRPAVAEIGHLRPGLHCERSDMTVESLASGWGIAAAARERFTAEVVHWLARVRDLSDESQRRARLEFAVQEDEEYLADLWQRSDGDLAQLSARHVAQAAAEGNEVAHEVLRHAVEALGWAIAQVVTITAAETIVVGGGVAQAGPSLFWEPLVEQVARFVFPPLLGGYQLRPAALGELVVVHGALALAAS
ncbi:MAG: ROK family protein [Planctomycetales bacterium]|nr:ROK family protein [Planctomycetales bacterium]